MRHQGRQVSAYWPGPWSCEDGGPQRRQSAGEGRALGIGASDRVEVTSRLAPAATMLVTGEPGALYLLRHTAGDDAISFVERIDPHDLEPIVRSADLAGGPTWPGSVAVHANGSIYVVFGNHAHRLDARPVGDGQHHPAPEPALQRLRAPARRLSGDEGLRRLPARHAGAGGRTPGRPARRPRAREPGDRRHLHPAPSPRSPACRPTATSSTSSGTPACCASGGTVPSVSTSASTPGTGPCRDRPTAGTA